MHQLRNLVIFPVVNGEEIWGGRGGGLLAILSTDINQSNLITPSYMQVRSAVPKREVAVRSFTTPDQSWIVFRLLPSIEPLIQCSK